jgi:hypothetical protein
MGDFELAHGMVHSYLWGTWNDSVEVLGIIKHMGFRVVFS